MKRTRFGRRTGLTRDAEQLARFALGLARSGSRVEDAFWDARAVELIDRLLAAGGNEALNTALDELYRSDAGAYGELADLVEARAESGQYSVDGQEHDALLLAIPVLAWSRFGIASGTISGATLAELRVQLGAHVLAADARLGLADFLFSPDQLPQGYAETRALAAKLTAAALNGTDFNMDARRLPETASFLSDMRYLLAVAAVPRGAPLFRWQEADGSREQAAERWRDQGGACIQPLFTGCSFELVLPEAYHAACREADRQIRPYSLRASVSFLQLTLNLPASELRAVMAPFSEQRLEEVRVGFTRRDHKEVLHGVVWPLLDAEDESSEVPQQIEAVLRECGVEDIVAIEHAFPLEYCDDCGAPLYPDSEGQAVHAEMPEAPDDRPAHLH